MIERTCGRSRRENAGISSESKVRILAVENLRFPGEGSSAQGKSGPKERPKGVSDGQQVEIPALQIYLNMQGTQEWKISEEEEKLVSQDIVKIISNELSRNTLTRKACRYCIKVPVPQTDTGR